MSKRILQCIVKTIDEKGHIKTWNENEITISFFKEDDDSKPKEAKKESKSKIKKILSKKE